MPARTSVAASLLLGAIAATAAALLSASTALGQALKEPINTLAIHYAPAPITAQEPALALRLSERFAARARTFLADMLTAEQELSQRGDASALPLRPTFTRTLESEEFALEARLEGGAPGRLISVEIVDFLYEGGAHPISLREALIWDAASKQAVGLDALFGATSPPAVLVEAWRAVARAEQRQRFAAQGDDGWAQNREAVAKTLDAAPVVLAASTEPGKAGGLIFLHDPYKLGPYVHGPYRLTIPQAAFAEALSPAYRSYFAGEPVEP